MLYSKLLVALFALPAALAQDAAPSDAAAPAAETPAADPAASPAADPAADPAAESPAADAGAAGADSAAAPAETTRSGSVGGNTENTGHGITGNGTGAWNVTSFLVPNTEVYCECLDVVDGCGWGGGGWWERGSPGRVNWQGEAARYENRIASARNATTGGVKGPPSLFLTARLLGIGAPSLSPSCCMRETRLST